MHCAATVRFNPAPCKPDHSFLDGDDMKFDWKQFAIALGLFLLGYLTFGGKLLP